MVEFSLKSKTNSEETFDATEELGNLNKNNGVGTSGDNNNKKKNLWNKLHRSEKSGSGTKSRATAKPKFLLG